MNSKLDSANRIPPNVKSQRSRIQGWCACRHDCSGFPVVFPVGRLCVCAEYSDGLCCRLLTPCPKEAELVPFKNLEVPRNNLQLVNKLGAGQFGEVWAGKMSVCLSVCVRGSLFLFVAFSLSVGLPRRICVILRNGVKMDTRKKPRH